jgi:UPF0042 nucleotide-binding protein
MRILIITGLSGAGKSVALKTFEDIGFEAVDNVPLLLIHELVASANTKSNSTIAIGVDVRNRDFSIEHFREMIETLKKEEHKVEVIFLDCDDKVLQQRFTETRRKHPLATDRPVTEGIARERTLLADVQNLADVTFDTSEWTGGDLRNALREHCGDGSRVLSVFVTSFSFKHGVPRDADIVFDVRFLRNPFYIDSLRHLTGKDKNVAEFIESDPDEQSFFKNLLQLLEPVLPRYLQEGKSYLTIAIGCTGGQHRSVFIAEKLAGFLKQKEYKVSVRHRDLEKTAPDPGVQKALTNH